MNFYESNRSIKNWAEDDRPREKLLLKGKLALSDAELIAILIGSGSREQTAVELSQEILKSVDCKLNELGKLSVNDLMKFKGIGEAKAITIVSALELGLRKREETIEEKKKIGSSKDVYELFYKSMADLPYEEFWILLLNRANKIINKMCISRGGVSGTVTDLRLIFKPAIESLASSIILCHNHPSGNLKPSDADIKITKQCVETGKVMDIPVLDHIIVTESSFFSFADEGLI
jgi:DNA repair protein RadC